MPGCLGYASVDYHDRRKCVEGMTGPAEWVGHAAFSDGGCRFPRVGSSGTISGMSEVFEGNRLESGVLQRVRRWRDAIPALVLVESLRVAGSPIHVGLAWLTLAVQELVFFVLNRASRGFDAGAGHESHADGVVDGRAIEGKVVDIATMDLPVREAPVDLAAHDDPTHDVAVPEFAVPDVSVPDVSVVELPMTGWYGRIEGLGDWPFGDLVERIAGLGPWWGTLAVLVLALVWVVPVSLAARAGACYAAGRPQAFLNHLGVVRGRVMTLLGVILLPLLMVGAIGVVLGLIGKVAGWIADLPIGLIPVWMLVVLALPFAIVAGVILAGAWVAVPLGLAGAAIEKQEDSFDALSRGYEYLLRRPVHLVVYGGVCWLLVKLMLFAGGMLVGSASLVVDASIGWGGRFPEFASLVAGVLSRLPLGFGIAAAWGLIGGLYLLMRQAANDQEIEDIPVSPIDLRPTELPTLRPDVGNATTAASSHGTSSQGAGSPEVDSNNPPTEPQGR